MQRPDDERDDQVQPDDQRAWAAPSAEQGPSQDVKVARRLKAVGVVLAIALAVAALLWAFYPRG
ncbi:MAG TPA: hypothetical protein VFL57_16760 [Bryobacteraceae bacterium]|nr:hypothetical protein [Bryobacteraceae bacterium]